MHPNSVALCSSLQKILSASMLGADFGCLAEEAKKAIAGGAKWLHIDVMDGHFVPNLSMGSAAVSALCKHHKDIFMDVHLMVSEPQSWVETFALAGASQYTFHYEAVQCKQDILALAQAIVAAGMKAGLSIKPNTPFDQSICDCLDSKLFSLLLIMTVEPGFGGQAFMPSTMEKVTTCRRLYPDLNIAVDGGLNETTAKLAIAAGANVIVAGTSLFRAPDVSAACHSMLEVMEKA